MADYYTKFSFILADDLSDEEIAWVERAKRIITKYDDEIEEKTGYRPEGFDIIDMPGKGKALWVHGIYSPEAAVFFSKIFLKRWRPNDVVGFQFSYDCTKPRINVYGGGAVVFTCENEQWMGTLDLEDMLFRKVFLASESAGPPLLIGDIEDSITTAMELRELTAWLVAHVEPRHRLEPYIEYGTSDDGVPLLMPTPPLGANMPDPELYHFVASIWERIQEKTGNAAKWDGEIVPDMLLKVNHKIISIMETYRGGRILICDKEAQE